jgi:hypothetical protein
VFVERLVAREVEVVELGAVVITDEAGHLLEMLGLELDHGGGAVAEGLLPPGDEGLFERAPDGFPTEKPEMPRARG